MFLQISNLLVAPTTYEFAWIRISHGLGYCVYVSYVSIVHHTSSTLIAHF